MIEKCEAIAAAANGSKPIAPLPRSTVIQPEVTQQLQKGKVKEDKEEKIRAGIIKSEQGLN